MKFPDCLKYMDSIVPFLNYFRRVYYRITNFMHYPDRVDNHCDPVNQINTQFDIPEMMDGYTNNRNYEIIDFNNDDDRCIIYFSGNGLSYPNDSETFHKKIIENNRFEWKRNIPLFVKRVIFLRDITK